MYSWLCIKAKCIQTPSTLLTPSQFIRSSLENGNKSWEELNELILMMSDIDDVTIMSLEHKTSHKSQFSVFEIYRLSESWINNISIDVWFVMIGQYLKIWNLRVPKNRNIEKIIFKVVQMKFLAMHINNQKYLYGRKCTKYLDGTWS